MEKIKNQRNAKNSKRMSLSIAVVALSSVVLSGCSGVLYGYNFNMSQHDNDSTPIVGNNHIEEECDHEWKIVGDIDDIHTEICAKCETLKTVFPDNNEAQNEKDYLNTQYAKLLEVREKLNISNEEDTKYSNINSIGDIVNLIDDNVGIYRDRDSLKNHENSTTSLYGTSIYRCIQAIDMANDYETVTVDNMEDYEFYLNNVYYEIGYCLVNEYSLDENGNLITELRCEKEDVYSLSR